MVPSVRLPQVSFPHVSQDDSLTWRELPSARVVTKIVRELVPALPVARRTRLLAAGCGVKIHFPYGLGKGRYNCACQAVSAALDDRRFDAQHTD